MSSSFPPQPPFGNQPPSFGGGQPPFGGGQPPYGGGQPPYGGGQYPGGQFPGGPQYPKSNKAVVALVLVLVGFFCCGPFTSVPAIFVAKSELDAIKAGQADPSNTTLAQVGFWGGIALTALAIIGVLIYALVFGLSLATIPLSNL